MFDGHDQLMTRVEALERAILSLAASQLQELGDIEGHPFHGNQYTGGSGRVTDAVPYTASQLTGKVHMNERGEGHIPTTANHGDIVLSQGHPMSGDPVDVVLKTDRGTELLRVGTVSEAPDGRARYDVPYQSARGTSEVYSSTSSTPEGAALQAARRYVIMQDAVRLDERGNQHPDDVAAYNIARAATGSRDAAISAAQRSAADRASRRSGTDPSWYGQ